MCMGNLIGKVACFFFMQETYMGASKNRGTPKWMIYKGNPIRIDDLGVPLFLEPYTPISFDQTPRNNHSKTSQDQHTWMMLKHHENPSKPISS